MSFGRQSGPPASAKQMDYLRSLVEKAGHDGFRDARGPLGLTQRQAGGKFTRGEASELIDRLVDGGDGGGDGGGGGGPAGGSARTGAAAAGQLTLSPEERREEEQAAVLRDMPAGLLAGELERRGWTVTSPF